MARLMIVYGVYTLAFGAMFFVFPDQRDWINSVGCNGFILIYFCMAFLTSMCILSVIDSNLDREFSIPVSEVAESISLQMVLEDKESLHLLMLHLSQSFSMEILLSLIEFVQFQDVLMDKLNVSPPPHAMSIEFPESIPISEIIESQMANTDKLPMLTVAKRIAHGLHLKYIAIGGEYEINISYAQRSRLQRALGDLQRLSAMDINAATLFNLFEKCKKEMMAYLGDHFSRFRRQKEFKKVIKAFHLVNSPTNSATPSPMAPPTCAEIHLGAQWVGQDSSSIL